MNNIISHYRRLGTALQPPASADAIQELETALECRLPDDLKALYADHDGAIAARPAAGAVQIPMRLMPISEAVKSHKFVREFGWAGMGFRLFWTDDNSNYAGVYVDGPLLGRVAWVDHEEQDLAPAFRSTSSFLTKLLTAAEDDLDWHQIEKDYPSLVAADTDDDDWAAAKLLEPLFAAEEDDQIRIQYACSIMAVTPPVHAESLIKYTFDDDFYVQERACAVLGMQKYEPAIDRLAEVAALEIPNAPYEAMAALEAIGTPYALQKLHEVEREA